MTADDEDDPGLVGLPTRIGYWIAHDDGVPGYCPGPIEDVHDEVPSPPAVMPWDMDPMQWTTARQMRSYPPRRPSLP